MWRKQRKNVSRMLSTNKNKSVISSSLMSSDNPHSLYCNSSCSSALSSQPSLSRRIPQEDELYWCLKNHRPKLRLEASPMARCCRTGGWVIAGFVFTFTNNRIYIILWKIVCNRHCIKPWILIQSWTWWENTNDDRTDYKWMLSQLFHYCKCYCHTILFCLFSYKSNGCWHFMHVTYNSQVLPSQCMYFSLFPFCFET